MFHARQIQGQTLELHQGDITQQAVDAIVNAANSRLAGGGGVDGAIHRRGGPQVMQDTDRRYPQGCPTGSAVISTAGQLPAKYVIHAVGPVWNGGGRGEAELLAGGVPAEPGAGRRTRLPKHRLARFEHGAYRFPMDQAARIALGTAIEFLRQHARPALVRFVLFDAGAYGAFAAALEERERTTDQ